MAEYIKIETYAGYNVQDIVSEAHKIHYGHGMRYLVHLCHIPTQRRKSSKAVAQNKCNKKHILPVFYPAEPEEVVQYEQRYQKRRH